jgi:hypothetical protein
VEEPRPEATPNPGQALSPKQATREKRRAVGSHGHFLTDHWHESSPSPRAHARAVRVGQREQGPAVEVTREYHYPCSLA